MINEHENLATAGPFDTRIFLLDLCLCWLTLLNSVDKLIAIFLFKFFTSLTDLIEMYILLKNLPFQEVFMNTILDIFGLYFVTLLLTYLAKCDTCKLRYPVRSK